jgi:hypothetical protein
VVASVRMVMEAPVGASDQRKRPVLVAVVLALVLAAVGSACTGDDNDDDTKPPKDDKAEVKAAYLAYWDMLERLSEAPNPDDPEIATLATGQARTDLVEGLSRLKQAGQRLSTGDRTSHTVSDITIRKGKPAQLRDCDVDDSSLLDRNGEVLDQAITTTLWDVRLVGHDGDWSVAEFRRVKAWKGEEDCR